MAVQDITSTPINNQAIAMRMFLEAKADEEARKAAEKAGIVRTEIAPLGPGEEVEYEAPGVVGDPGSWLNRGLGNILSGTADILLGRPSGNDLVDMGIANIPGAGAGAILAAGGMPGIVDISGLPSFAKRYPEGFRILIDMMKNPSKHSQNAHNLFNSFYKGGTAFEKSLSESRAVNGRDLVDMNLAKRTGRFVPEKAEKNIIEQMHLNELFGNMSAEERKLLLSTELDDAESWLEKMDKYAEFREAETKRLAEEKARKLEEAKQAAQHYNLFTSNPRKAAQEMVEKNMDIEGYLGDHIGDIRPGQRKQVENELRKLGVDIPEEVVEAAPVVEKKVKAKEVQIPKSEQQRLQAIETAQKTWKREPNKVFKSISKGRSPEDYFKGAENVPDDFADKYAQYLADKEGRKAAQAAEAERAAQAAEAERQNAAATSKQLEREEADRIARERIAEERDKAAAERAATKLAYDSRRPSAVIASGWKPEEHPLNIYTDAPTEPARYATMDSRANPFTPEEKRDLFVADSIAGEVLRNLEVADEFGRTRIGGPGGISSNEARHRDDLTNYEKLWPQYARKMDEARELGLLSDNVKRTKKPTPNKDGSINMVDTDVIELSHPANTLMNAIYGDGKSDNVLNLYDLMFRRNLDDILHEKNRYYKRQLNTQDNGSRAYRILESLKR